jgi:hypothetical protein
MSKEITRRRFLQIGVAVLGGVVLEACSAFPADYNTEVKPTPTLDPEHISPKENVVGQVATIEKKSVGKFRLYHELKDGRIIIHIGKGFLDGLKINETRFRITGPNGKSFDEGFFGGFDRLNEPVENWETLKFDEDKFHQPPGQYKIEIIGRVEKLDSENPADAATNPDKVITLVINTKGQKEWSYDWDATTDPTTGQSVSFNPW